MVDYREAEMSRIVLAPLLKWYLLFMYQVRVAITWLCIRNRCVGGDMALQCGGSWT